MSSVADRLNKKSEIKNSKARDKENRLRERASNSGIWGFGNLEQRRWYKVLALEKA